MGDIRESIKADQEEAIFEQGLESYIDMVILDPQNCSISVNEHHNFKMLYQDKEYDQVSFVRAFPLSIKDRFISVMDKDKKEIGMLLDLDDFEAEIRERINESLHIRYFTPEILSIAKLKEEYGYGYFTVLTTAGEREFIANRHDRPLLKLKDSTMQLTDTDGNRYLIRELEKLEDKHLKIVENYL